MTNTDTATLDVTTLLERSLAAFRERGMAKWELTDPEGRVCVRGAVMVALGADLPDLKIEGWKLWRQNQKVVRPTEILLGQAAARVNGARGFCYDADPDYLVAFNNHPDTTQEEMERVFEAAIAESREQTG